MTIQQLVDRILEGVLDVRHAKDFLAEGAAEHELLKDHEKNPYHKVLTKHGFVHQYTAHKHNYLVPNNSAADYTEHAYVHPGHGRSHVIVTQEHSKGKAYKNDPMHHWLHRHEQSNGIMSPCTGWTKPQLDRALTQEYGQP